MNAKDRLDLVKLHPEEYRAGKRPTLVEIGLGTYLTFAGKGLSLQGPNPFQVAIRTLYWVAWTLRFARKAAARDFRVTPPEATWWLEGIDARAARPEEWCWKARVRVPDDVTEAEVAGAIAVLRAKGKQGDFGGVRLERIDDGMCVKMLHVGPYEAEWSTLEAMHEFAVAQGLELGGPHHELYLSDPNRTPPERNRTILRHPVVRRAA